MRCGRRQLGLDHQEVLVAGPAPAELVSVRDFCGHGHRDRGPAHRWRDIRRRGAPVRHVCPPDRPHHRSGAALAAATAAAQTLDAADWDCTDAGPQWEAAVSAAAQAAAARTAHSSAATATDYTLATDAGCTVVASVRVGAAGARRWLEATAVACAPTRAAAASGWTLTPTC